MDKTLTKEQEIKCDALGILLDELQEDVLVLRYKLRDLRKNLSDIKRGKLGPPEDCIQHFDPNEGCRVLEQYERGKVLSQADIAILVKTVKFYKRAADVANGDLQDVLRFITDSKTLEEVKM